MGEIKQVYLDIQTKKSDIRAQAEADGTSSS